MPRVNHPIVLTKKCPLCPDGTWNIRHFNGNPSCTRYASCSCGGQVRADNNQKIFHEYQPVTEQEPVTGREKQETRELTTGSPVTEIIKDDDEENQWMPF